MRRIILLISLVGCINCFAQSRYDIALAELKGMLTDSLPINFKRAVYITENAYLNSRLDQTEFNSLVSELARKCKLISEQSDLSYRGKDKVKVQKYASVFRIMTDTTRFYYDSVNYNATLPFVYDFDDFLGEKDWRKMFVSKLLITKKGNCHSLPFLYKILCEELGVKAYLSMAPNHTYIKLWCEQTGWYNTELTSGHFPIDAWIMASGYVHLSAVQNRLYMDTLSDKQSIAVCLTDLAKGYQKKYGDKADLDFILKSVNLALEYYPQYVNALLLKAETIKKKFEFQMVLNKAEYPSDLFNKPDSKRLFDEMQNLYFHIHQLGYRKMPTDMYISWLSDLKREKQKYLNKEAQNIISTK